MIPLYRFHQWQANLRLLYIQAIKTVPCVPRSHPVVERLIGTVRREYLDRLLFWTAADLERKLVEFQQYSNEHRTHTGLQGARRRRARTPPALGPVSERIGGSRTVVGCITHRAPRTWSIRNAFTAAIYEFATHIRPPHSLEPFSLAAQHSARTARSLSLRVLAMRSNHINAH